MPRYKFEVTRKLVAEIEVDEENYQAAEEEIKQRLSRMGNSEFDEVDEETYELIEAPVGEKALHYYTHIL